MGPIGLAHGPTAWREVMTESSDSLRLILGLKLRNLRLARDEGLRDVASRAGLSVSYLSEVEQGKKYPKPDKLLRLAAALEIAYDDLVSSKVTAELGPLKAAVSSGFLREFPFELFGLEREDLVRLISDAPGKTGALIQTLVDIGRSYDVQVEHFLLSALRSFQQMHANYFEELELAASDFRQAQKWVPGEPVEAVALARFLESQWGYRIDRETISDNSDLRGFRSVFVAGPRPLVHLNRRLLPIQQAFILAREVGYRILGLEERVTTSSWIKVESFAQVLNNFKASYFAGALLMDRASLGGELKSLFSRSTWDSQSLLEIMARYRATPEMFLYRLTELVPQLFGLEKLFFLRFHKQAETEGVGLTKVFNLSGVPVPYGLGLKEHYCRRWPGVRLLSTESSNLPVEVQRSRFLNQDAEFFVLTMGRPLALDPLARSTVSIGLLLDERCKRTLRFWNDPAIEQVEVNLTCERCPFDEEDCKDRVALPTMIRQQAEQRRMEAALAELS